MPSVKIGSGKRKFPRQAPQPAAEPSTDWRRHLPSLLIVAAISLTFWPLLTFDFTAWDDNVLIYKNPTLNPPTLHSLWVWWTQPTVHLWNPVTNTVQGALALIGSVSPDPSTGSSLNPYVFHAANLLIHLCVTLIVYQILRLLRFPTWPACLGALVFGLHPLQVEPVAWTSAMKDTLCGVFSLAAVWVYLFYRGFSPDDEPSASSNSGESSAAPTARGYFWLATGLFFLGALSKPTAIVLPLVVLALSLLLPSLRGRRLLRDMGIWAIVALPSIIVTKVVQRPMADVVIALWKRPLVAADALAFYVYKLVWPAALAIDYGRSPPEAFARHWVYWTWVVPATIAGIAVIYRKRVPALAAGAAIFVAFLLPVLGLMTFDFQWYSTVADRYAYLSMFGVALLVAWGAAQLPRRTRLVPWVLVLVLATRSWLQTWYWSDTITLLKHTEQINPTSFAALQNLAVEYAKLRQVDTEIDYSRKAMAVKPWAGEPYLQIASAWIKLNRWDKALEVMEQGYAANPSRIGDEAVAIANDYGKKRLLKEAIFYGKLAVKYRPNDVGAHVNLGSVYALEGDRVGALAELNRAVELDPKNAMAQTNLATTLASGGQIKEARRHYQDALKADPDTPAAREGLMRLNELDARGTEADGRSTEARRHEGTK